MTAAAKRRASLWAPLADPVVPVIALIGAGIAWLTPFDKVFAAATFGQPALCALAIAAMTLVGAVLAPRVGLQVREHGLRRPILFPLAVSLSVAVWCVAIDALMVRHVAQASGYAANIQGGSMIPRLTYFILRAFNENILYRLFGATVLAWAFARMAGARGAAPPWAILGGIMAAQLVNVLTNITCAGGPVTAFSLAYDALRYFAPGCVWGLLYWRHGFVSNEVACTSVHLFFQPLATIGLMLVS